MSQNYYCLVSSLTEYAFDADHKAFDASALREEIRDQLTAGDTRAMDDLYTYYDIINLANRFNCNNIAFNSLGNIPDGELVPEAEVLPLLPKYLRGAARAFLAPDPEAEGEPVDTSAGFENTLLAAYYQAMRGSASGFLRQWCEFDMNVRNLSVAFLTRKAKKDISDAGLIGSNAITEAIRKSPASDFGLKGEVDYIDPLVQALETGDILDRERKMDLLRWKFADEITTFDYFNMDKVLAYLAKVNIIHRWMVLDKETGRQLFARLRRELSASDTVARAGEELKSKKEINKD